MSNGTEQFTIGSAVRCADGDCGTLRRVVVEPIDRVLTHLVVEPEDRERAGRLVPVDLVDWEAQAATASVIVLRCTVAQFESADEAQETHFLTGTSGQWGYEQDQVLSWPNYPLGGAVGAGQDTAIAADDTLVAADGLAADAPAAAPAAAAVADVNVDVNADEGVSSGMEGFSTDAGPHVVVRERVPVGEVLIRRGEHVQAVDGSIGRVQGLVVDVADRRVTHVLLDQGHLWGQKRVAIPIGAVADIQDGVRIDLTKDQVRDLPEVDVDL